MTEINPVVEVLSWKGCLQVGELLQCVSYLLMCREEKASDVVVELLEESS